MVFPFFQRQNFRLHLQLKSKQNNPFLGKPKSKSIATLQIYSGDRVLFQRTNHQKSWFSSEGGDESGKWLKCWNLGKNWKDIDEVKENMERSKRKSFAWWVLKKTPFWKRTSWRIWRWIDEEEEEECKGVGSGCLREWEEGMKWLREWRNKKFDLRNLKNVFGFHNLRPLRLGRMANVSYDYGSQFAFESNSCSQHETKSKSKQTPHSFTLLLKIYSLFAYFYHFLCFLRPIKYEFSTPSNLSHLIHIYFHSLIKLY